MNPFFAFFMARGWLIALEGANESLPVSIPTGRLCFHLRGPKAAAPIRIRPAP